MTSTAPGLKESDKNATAIVGLLFASILAALWVQWPVLSDPQFVQNDARIHIWWMRIFSDPSVFESDGLARMMEAKSWRNPGFMLLFRATARWIDPVNVSTILSILILPLTVCLIVLAGRALKNIWSGFLAGGMYLVMSLHSWNAGLTVFDGLQRSFRDPIFALAIWALARKSRAGFLAACLAGALFYPITLPVIAMAYGAHRLHLHKAPVKTKRITAACLILIMALTAGAAWAVFHQTPFYGFTGSLFDNPRFSAQGREPVFENTSHFLGIPGYLIAGKSGGLLGHTNDQAILAAILILIAVGFCVSGRTIAPSPQLLWFLSGSLFCFFAAWIIAIAAGRFILYFPGRYLPLTLLAALWIGSTPKPGATWKNLTVVLMIFVIPFTSAVLLTPGKALIEQGPGYVRPTAWEYGLLKELKNQPIDTVVAGPPYLMNNIPIHSNRSVFLSFEMDTEMREDWARRRFTDFFRAYYAETRAEVQDFCRQNGVNLMLIDQRLFAGEFLESCRTGAQSIYLEPHNSETLNFIGNRTEFALQRLENEVILFQHGPFTLIEVIPAAP